MASLQDIFSWFQTDDMPTEVQFKATWSSFWHKDELIPTDSIKGFNKLLQNTATTEQVEIKANRDATNLKDEDIANWKLRLGVGTLPANIATYDPAKVNYVMMKDGTDKPAGDLGKNMANSALTTIAGAGVTQGANYPWNTAGYYLYLTGTPDKSADATFIRMMVQDANGQVAWSNGRPILESVMASMADKSNDAAFSEYLVRNPTTGRIEKSSKPQIVTTNNFPSQITVNYNSSIANSNYIPSPTTPADIADTYNMIKNLESAIQFTTFLASEMLVKKLPVSKYPTTLQSNYNLPSIFTVADGVLYNNNNKQIPSSFFETSYRGFNEMNDCLEIVILNKQMPSDKDWAIKFHSITSGRLLGSYTLGFFGLVPDVNHFDYIQSRDFNIYSPTSGINLNRFGSSSTGWTTTYLTFYLIKKGSKLSLYIIDNSNNSQQLLTYDYDANFEKFLRFGHNFSHDEGYGIIEPFMLKDISYWIQP